MKADVRNLTAPKAYGFRVDELLALVRELEADVVNRILDARTVNWGHVGDMGRALELAQQLQDFLRGNVE